MAPTLTTRRFRGLPAEVTGFVGRRAELAQLAGLLESARLITVTGPGGVGKTRVTLRAAALAAAGYADGVCLVELSWLRDAELLPHTVAAALALPQSDAQLDAVLDFLRERQLLLVLDTCEHLLDACAMLADMVLRECPEVTVLATSRQPLDVPGEHACPIPPLPVGDGDGDSAELFAQRAAAAVPGFIVTDVNRADVLRVCKRLDGIPLAIELATVRLRALPLAQLADRLENRFRVLDGGLRTALPRHKTLRTAIEWSHDLCTSAEQALWARLSVFAGSFDVAAAEEVCADDKLDRDEIVNALIGLVDKSVLLREEGDGGTRYRLLDTLREFGAEQLNDSDQQQEFQGRHLARYRAAAESFTDHLMDDQLARYRALRREDGNIRAALEYALSLPGKDGEVARLAAGLRVYWHIAGLVPEAEYWLGRILDRFPDPSLDRARVLLVRCGLFSEEAEGREAIAIAERLGEARLAAEGYLFINLSIVQTGPSEEGRRIGALAERLLEAVGDRFGLLSLDVQLAGTYSFAGEPEGAITRAERGLRRAAGSGEVWQTASLHHVIGFALLQQGEYRASADALRTSLIMRAELGDPLGMAFSLEVFAWLAVRQQRYDRTAWLLGAAGALWERANGGEPVTVYEFMRAWHLQAEDTARGPLGGDGYAALYRTGYEYPLDQLIPLAINDADKLPQATPEQDAADQAGPLTTREREIAALVAAGLSNRDIAERLVISKRTVDAHVEHIYTKLGITSRVQLTNWLKP